MSKPNGSVTQQIARAVVAFIFQRTGQLPRSVDVVRRAGAFVITLRNMLAAGGQARSELPGEAAKRLEVCRELFVGQTEWLRGEIGRITRLQMPTVSAAVVTATGVLVVHVTGRAPGLSDSTPVRGGGATNDSQEWTAPEPIRAKRLPPKSATGSIIRACDPNRRTAIPFAPQVRPGPRLASGGVTGAGSRCGGST